MEGRIEESTIVSLYLRPSAIWFARVIRVVLGPSRSAGQVT